MSTKDTESIDLDDVHDYIRKNLSVVVDVEDGAILIEIRLAGVVISEDSVRLPDRS